jgi:hypothetical protein
MLLDIWQGLTDHSRSLSDDTTEEMQNSNNSVYNNEFHLKLPVDERIWPSPPMVGPSRITKMTRWDHFWVVYSCTFSSTPSTLPIAMPLLPLPSLYRETFLRWTTPQCAHAGHSCLFEAQWGGESEKRGETLSRHFCEVYLISVSKSSTTNNFSEEKNLMWSDQDNAIISEFSHNTTLSIPTRADSPSVRP